MIRLTDILSPSETYAFPISLETQVTEITDQSDRVGKGSLFFAISGKSRDGHAFVAQALQLGAVAAVVEKTVIGVPEARQILVPSTRRALALAWSRCQGNPSSQFKIVGVTGTNGKTTTTFLLSQVWQGLGLRSGLIGTVETRIADRVLDSNLTTPGAEELQRLFRAMSDAQIAAAAIEVSSIALDQYRTWGTQFEIALFTNLTQDHLDYHGDFETYYQAKRKLFTDYAVKRAVLNLDDPWAQRLKQEMTIPQALTFGFDPAADFSPVSFELGTDGTRARLKTPRGPLSFSTRLTGRHNLSNCLGVLAACEGLGLELHDVAAVLAEAPGASGRLERVELGEKRPSVFVDYAHSPDALANVLRTLQELRGSGGKIFTVFGCGGDRDRKKRPLMGEVASKMSDVTIATSDNPRTEEPNSILDEIEPGVLKDRTCYLRDPDRRRAIQLALSQAQASDIVLIAGKGHETYQILGTEKVPFDDRLVVRDYYQ